MSHCLAPGCGREVTQGVAFCHEHVAEVPQAIRARMKAAHARIVTAQAQLAAARLAYAVAVADALRLAADEAA